MAEIHTSVISFYSWSCESVSDETILRRIIDQIPLQITKKYQNNCLFLQWCCHYQNLYSYSVKKPFSEALKPHSGDWHRCVCIDKYGEMTIRITFFSMFQLGVYCGKSYINIKLYKLLTNHNNIIGTVSADWLVN